MVEEPESRREEKAALREEVLLDRERLSESERTEKSEKVIRQVRALASYERAEIVLAYSGFGSELRTVDFLRCVLEDGKILALPKIRREERRLTLHEIRNLDEDLEAGVWDIREPKEDLTPVELSEVDFALVPGVAFDARCRRLGHGAGFYDRLLGELPSNSPPLVAGAFDVQIVSEVPTVAHDVMMDHVITESFFYPKERSGP